MEDSQRLDNTIDVFSEVLEEYKDREDIKEIYDDLSRLKEKRRGKNN